MRKRIVCECGRVHYIDPAKVMGAKGGAAGTGKAKARSSSAARKAVRARWARYRAELDSDFEPVPRSTISPPSRETSRETKRETL